MIFLVILLMSLLFKKNNYLNSFIYKTLGYKTLLTFFL